MAYPSNQMLFLNFLNSAIGLPVLLDNICGTFPSLASPTQLHRQNNSKVEKKHEKADGIISYDAAAQAERPPS